MDANALAPASSSKDDTIDANNHVDIDVNTSDAILQVCRAILSCPVCKKTIRECAMLLPCTHRFCVACVRPLKKCPYTKCESVVDNEHVVDDRLYMTPLIELLNEGLAAGEDDDDDDDDDDRSRQAKRILADVDARAGDFGDKYEHYRARLTTLLDEWCR
ncbi:MAG: hypothetical protein KDA51_05320, partial [Planctomycetales bacterium]|nr:hypothetical protein [Planctomycetales bacterium]